MLLRTVEFKNIMAYLFSHGNRWVIHMGKTGLYFFHSFLHTTYFLNVHIHPLTILAVIIAVYGYIPYLSGIVRDKIFPHPYSWSIWTGLTFIGVLVQISEGANFGVLPLLTNTLLTGVVTIAAFRKIKKSISPIQHTDKFAIYASVAGVMLWILFQNPIYAAIAITLADTVGYIPTFIKAYHAPEEESFSVYLCSGTSHALSLFALSVHTIPAVLYQGTLVFLAYSFCIFLFYMKKPLTNKNREA